MVRKEIYTKKICLNCWGFNHINPEFKHGILDAKCSKKEGVDTSKPPFCVNVKHDDVACGHFSNASTNTIRGRLSRLEKALEKGG